MALKMEYDDAAEAAALQLMLEEESRVLKNAAGGVDGEGSETGVESEDGEDVKGEANGKGVEAMVKDGITREGENLLDTNEKEHTQIKPDADTKVQAQTTTETKAEDTTKDTSPNGDANPAKETPGSSNTTDVSNGEINGHKSNEV